MKQPHVIAVGVRWSVEHKRIIGSAKHHTRKEFVTNEVSGSPLLFERFGDFGRHPLVDLLEVGCVLPRVEIEEVAGQESRIYLDNRNKFGLLYY